MKIKITDILLGWEASQDLCDSRVLPTRPLFVKATHSWLITVRQTCGSNVALESSIPEPGEFVRHHPLSQVRVFSTEASGIFAELL